MKDKRRFFRAGRLIWLAVLAAVLWAPVRADAAGRVFDCTDDQTAYAQLVARLNKRGMPITASTAGAGGEMTAVLVKTEGGLPDAGDYIFGVAGPDGRCTLYYASEEEAASAASALRRTRGVIYAEKDSDVSACSAFHSWGAETMGFGAYGTYTQAWRSGGGVTAAVIDSGTAAHELLSGRVLTGGFDYVDADTDPTNDLFGHGTRVAGIIADCTQGLPVYVYPIRVLNANGGGKMSNVVNAVSEAVEAGVDIINLSLESKILSEALDAAIREAVAAGIVVSAAAGNGGTDTAGVCPAHLTDQGVIVVGSAEAGESGPVKAYYSNYGASVDVYAYGSGISCCSPDGGYMTDSGTSMAAPHISALCAMLKLIHPGLSPAEAESRIKAAASAGEINVPALDLMIPQDAGFSTDRLALCVGERVGLCRTAYPDSCREAVRYEVSDGNVAEVSDGVLTALSEGECTVTAVGTGLADAEFQLVVTADDGGAVVLPEDVTTIGKGAFKKARSIETVVLPEGLVSLGQDVFEHCSLLRWVSVPDSLTDLGNNDFSDAVILCGADSAAAAQARERGLAFIAAD